MPTYLHDRPRSVIIHCLDRKAKGDRFSANSIHDIDHAIGIFEVEKESGSRKTLNFGQSTEEGMPSCTCKDWQRFHLPCKHFFAVFQHRQEWQWEQLPQTYLQSAYLSTDSDALDRHFEITPPSNSVDLQEDSPEETSIADDIPRQVTNAIHSH